MSLILHSLWNISLSIVYIMCRKLFLRWLFFRAVMRNHVIKNRSLVIPPLHALWTKEICVATIRKIVIESAVLECLTYEMVWYLPSFQHVVLAVKKKFVSLLEFLS